MAADPVDPKALHLAIHRYSHGMTYKECCAGLEITKGTLIRNLREQGLFRSRDGHRKVSPHGTVTRYNSRLKGSRRKSGCRCALCKAAISAYKRASYAKAKALRDAEKQAMKELKEGRVTTRE